MSKGINTGACTYFSKSTTHTNVMIKEMIKQVISIHLITVADPDIRNIRRCECQIFRKLFAYKKMTIDKKSNRIGKTYCNDSPVMAPQSVILLVTLRK